VILKLGHNI